MVCLWFDFTAIAERYALILDFELKPMFSQLHYLVRSKKDGQYLVARPRSGSPNEAGFLLVFKEDYDARGYLNQHGGQVADRFGIEAIAGNQLKGLLQRWGFEGVGLVSDPLIPQIQFLTLE